MTAIHRQGCEGCVKTLDLPCSVSLHLSEGTVASSGSHKTLSKMTLKKWFILNFLSSIFPSFLSWENRVCKRGTSWKFYLSEVFCITTPRTLSANFLVYWVPKCTVVSCPVNVCESRDVSSRLSNSHHQPWQTDSGSILGRMLRQSLDSVGKSGEVCEGRRRGCVIHPQSLTCSGVSCGPLEFSRVWRNIF